MPSNRARPSLRRHFFCKFASMILLRSVVLVLG
nr:MAG TPA: hypothetical protein [Caudoviricetes sp.]